MKTIGAVNIIKVQSTPEVTAVRKQHKEVLDKLRPLEIQARELKKQIASLAKPSRVICVGNPPYQDSKNNPLYQKFVTASQSFADVVLFVIPKGWMVGGKAGGHKRRRAIYPLG